MESTATLHVACSPISLDTIMDRGESTDTLALQEAQPHPPTPLDLAPPSTGVATLERPLQKPRNRYARFRRTHPETEVWIRAGLLPRAAKALVEAGIRTPEDLRKCSREEVLALRGLGLEQLKRCERALGEQLPTRTPDYWTANGVHRNIAKALIRAGLRSIEDIEEMTREQLLFIPCVGEVAIRHLERLRGRPVPSFEDYWKTQGFDSKSALRLSRAGIRNLDELKRKSPAELSRPRTT